ncbi:ribosome hibernation-promoting factor, HPF/YfiA family [Allohahella sp. A8]|uniref:ribosome hibernation-promoting factor, HPF/YfiA family n=1 Tax=Allohahella sp. A8 TaxID=3141461 RepID=UPI000C0A56B6|nr:ribosomal subunit interface protein [Hahellaceae bacterium]|tara:strand:- start:55793 stop:56101 length:309 start_codon:yes stop_codon:yes gene_type:complete
MQLNITGQNIDLTDALKSHVEAKFNKLQRHVDSISNVQVTLAVEKQRQMAEATLHMSGSDVHANAEDVDMYTAIDQLADKLDRQVLKQKEKQVERNHGVHAR